MLEIMKSIIVLFLAIGMETIDSSLGMMYGTILSPVLILAYFDPKDVVPAILLSQAIGGFLATYHHHKFGNAEFSLKSNDLRIAILIVVLGTIAVGIGAYVGNIIPVIYLKSYIAVLCLLMGTIVLLKRKFRFSWIKISIMSIVSSFNKALSGGGFGPIVATGNIASGVEAKKAIGITDFAEAPICIIAFGLWFWFSGFNLPPFNLLVPLCIGSAIGGLIGPFILFKAKSKKMLTIVVGIMAIISGLFIILKIIM